MIASGAGPRGPAVLRPGLFGLMFLVVFGFATPAAPTLPSFVGGTVPSLAPLLKQVTPAVVNIAVRGARPRGQSAGPGPVLSAVLRHA